MGETQTVVVLFERGRGMLVGGGVGSFCLGDGERSDEREMLGEVAMDLIRGGRSWKIWPES